MRMAMFLVANVLMQTEAQKMPEIQRWECKRIVPAHFFFVVSMHR
jgi:hypothetical protein